MQPTERFSGLAEIYQASRPSYPKEAIDFILSHCRLSQQSLLVDVGCGTGISTRLFAERGIKTIGVEPNDDMRKTAEDAGGTGTVDGEPNPKYIAGTAENTTFEDQSVDAVLAAQAFHWFDPEKSLAEFHRILKNNAFVVLMWNERDEADSFTLEYGELFRKLPDTKSVELDRGKAGHYLMSSKIFKGAERFNFKNAQTLDLEGVMSRAFSASYAPRGGANEQMLRDGLTAAFHKFEKKGTVDLCYETSVYVAQK